MDEIEIMSQFTFSLIFCETKVLGYQHSLYSEKDQWEWSWNCPWKYYLFISIICVILQLFHIGNHFYNFQIVSLFLWDRECSAKEV